MMRLPAARSNGSPATIPAGWWRSGWSRRGSTCRGWPLASSLPAPRRRSSSPKRSDASSGPGDAASWRPSSCPRCRSCWRTRPAWNGNATMCLCVRRRLRQSTSGPRPTRCWSRRTAPSRRPMSCSANSRRSRRRRPSTTCCSTRRPTACTPPPPATTRRTTWDCPACWSPTRSHGCWPNGNADRCAATSRPCDVRRCHQPRRCTGRWPPSARS